MVTLSSMSSLQSHVTRLSPVGVNQSLYSYGEREVTTRRVTHVPPTSLTWGSYTN